MEMTTPLVITGTDEKAVSVETVEATMPAFTPVEVSLPFWPGARRAIEKSLPVRVGLRAVPEQNILARDSEWMAVVFHHMYNEIGEGHGSMNHDTLLAHLTAASDFGWSVVDPETLKSVLGMEINARSILIANGIIAKRSRDLEAAGRPTIEQRISHMLGLEPMPGHPFFKVEVKHGPI